METQTVEQRPELLLKPITRTSRLDWNKLKQFEVEYNDMMKTTGRDYTVKYNAFLKNWTGTALPPFYKAPYFPLSHWICTIKAHFRGRIHARHMIKQCEYGPYVPDPTKPVRHASPQKFKKLKTTYMYNINSLEDQARLFAEGFLERLEK